MSGRSIICPLGNQGIPFVAKGNLLLCRVMLLLVLAASKGCRYLLEQPGSSCLPYHPRWAWFVERVAAAGLHVSVHVRDLCESLHPGTSVAA